MINSQVRAGTTAFLTVSFQDQSGNPATPASVHVSVINRTPVSTVIRAEEQEPSAASTMQLMVTAAENELVNSDARQEVRRVKVRAVYGVSDEYVTTYDYLVVDPD